ncbi:MAG: sarcosine oxidase subunit gamma family protein [Rhodospirillaceae bacterium]
MADTYLRQSPLAHLHLDARAGNDAGIDDAGLVMGERRLLGMVNLRGDTADPAFAPAAAKALGVTLPTKAGTVAGDADGVHVLMLGPDEWLAVTPAGAEGGLTDALAEATVALYAAVTPVGEARTTIRVAGPDARAALNKGCALDLHPRAFGPGRCAQTILARADMTLHQIDDNAYDVIVLRSFAEYVWTWLEDAGREYGVKVVIT